MLLMCFWQTSRGLLAFVLGIDMVQLLLQADVVPKTDTILIIVFIVMLAIIWMILKHRRETRRMRES